LLTLGHYIYYHLFPQEDGELVLFDLNFVTILYAGSGYEGVARQNAEPPPRKRAVGVQTPSFNRSLRQKS
jgi:hypothetical protein